MKATQFDDILAKGHVRRISKSLNENTRAFEALVIVLSCNCHLINDNDVLLVHCIKSEISL